MKHGKWDKREEFSMYRLDKLEKKLLGSQVEEELMKYILNSPVKIGEKIPNEFELAEKFGVGRSTIREAVKGLVSKGVLEVRRGSGTYVVSTISVEDDPLGLSKLEDKFKLAMELLEVRLMLEPEIAQLAAKYATKEDKRHLKTLCDEVEELLTQGEDYIRKDVEFHTCIARCGKNRVVEMLGAVKSSVYIYMVPVVAVVASAIILGERLTWISLAGILLTLFGVTISEYRKKTRKSGKKRPS